MIYAKIIAKENNQREYTVSLSFINNFGIQIDIPLKFDTGASNTVISAKFFDFGFEKDYDGEKFEQKIIQYQKSKGVDLSENSKYVANFKSASGHNFKGYLSKIAGVEMDGVYLPLFCYYIIPKNGKIVSLLGNDFLRYCKYYHNIEGDIIITQFDDEKYALDCKNALTINEINTIINEIQYDSCKNEEDYGIDL